MDDQILKQCDFITERLDGIMENASQIASFLKKFTGDYYVYGLHYNSTNMAWKWKFETALTYSLESFSESLEFSDKNLILVLEKIDKLYEKISILCDLINVQLYGKKYSLSFGVGLRHCIIRNDGWLVGGDVKGDSFLELMDNLLEQLKWCNEHEN